MAAFFIVVFTLPIFIILYLVLTNDDIQSLKRSYTDALDRVKDNPNSPDERAQAIKIGRQLIKCKAMTEMALSQDLDAATAAATIGEGNAQRVTLKTSNDAPDGIAAEIAKLSELHTAGIITRDELDLGKNYLFGHDKTDELAKKIKTLHDLKQQGAITDGEFNLKKWDILAR